MNDKSANMHLISAYHDGELTAAEVVEVEQLLATSAEARAELESYRKISSLFREAGRPTLQSDLSPVVMQTIEQRMLLPTTAAQPLSETRQGKAWTKWAIAIAAAAAGLLVAVQFIPQNPAQAPAVAHHDVKPAPVAPQPEVVQPDMTKAVADVTPVNPVATPGPQLVSTDLPLEVIENLKRANPGKIVRFLKQSGKDVTVFHLMVLDIQPGLDSLQMILSAQQISGPQGQQAQPGTVAVYVQANQDQLDKVIAELQSEEQKQFVALAVQAPVKVEEVQKLVKNSAAAVASQQVPLKKSELTTLGVKPVEDVQIAASRTRRGQAAGPVQALNGGDSSQRKVLIVVEKAPESLLSQPVPPN